MFTSQYSGALAPFLGYLHKNEAMPVHWAPYSQPLLQNKEAVLNLEFPFFHLTGNRAIGVRRSVIFDAHMSFHFDITTCIRGFAATGFSSGSHTIELLDCLIACLL